MAPHPVFLPCALAFPPPSHRDPTTPIPCWAPHFVTQKRIMFSNSTPSKPRLSPATTMSDDTPSALTPPLHCSSILQPATCPQVVAFESETISAPICLNRFTPLPLVAPWPPRPPAIKTPTRSVPAGPSFHDPKTHHVLGSHPEQAAPLSSRDDERPLSLRPCTAPPSCSLQPILKLSLRPSLLQFVSIVSPLLNHGNPIFEPVCVLYLFLFSLYFSDRNELQL